MKTPCSSSFRLGAAFAAVLAATAAALAADVNAQLDRTTIALGDSAQLTLVVSGDSDGQVALPAVPGLEFVQVAQSSSYQSINGVTSSTTSVTYEVTPQHAGNFTIPAFRRGAPALVLHVQRSGVAASGNGGGAGLPPPALGGAEAAPTSLAPGGAAFARLRLPKHQLYVGEIVPVEIQVGLRPGMVASLNGLPALSGDAFTLNPLTSQPEQTQEIVGGQPYTVLTWHSVLAVVKPGNFSLSVATPLTVQVRVAPRRRGRRSSGGPFDDPFFDNALDDSFLQNFFGATTQKEITVTSDPDALQVLPLPSEGRPAGFSGAVGNFDVASELSADHAAAGDPLTLRMKVTGTGSFDRVESKMLGDVSGWKSYRPTSRFVASDSAGFGGEKDFEQAVIPEQPGRQTVPPLTFSFFNPVARRYETKQTPALAVTVSPTVGGSVAATSSPAPGPENLPATPPPVTGPGKDGLYPDQVEAGGTVATLQPLYFQPWFLGSQGALVLGFAASLLFQRARERRGLDQAGARRRVADAAMAGCLVEMEEAAAAGDAPRFFAAARGALQQRLGARWNVAPASITIADLDDRLNGGTREMRQIFSRADQAAYSRENLSPADLQEWQQNVRQQLNLAEEL
jgi:hypothetical protein